MKILWAGIDGLKISYLKEFSPPFWKRIQNNVSIGQIPCPEEIEKGQIATASSPRLWARMFTGVPPSEGGPTGYGNGIVGFWEKITEDGDVLRAKLSIDEIRENRCEKIVDYDDLLVKPLWEVALENGLSVGSCNAWFSFPIRSHIRNMIDENGGWMLTDWKFPRDHEKMKPDQYRWPPDAEPKDDFEEETGAGARVGILAQRDPEGLKQGMMKQDEDRYEYVLEQIEKRGTPDLCVLLTRGTDGIQHAVKNQEIADESDVRKVYEANMEGIEKLWNTGKFDTLIISSDHGSEVLEGGEAHSWPAFCIIYSPEGDFPQFDSLESRYEDIPATILRELGVKIPDWYDGTPLQIQADMSSKLRRLGYF